MHQRELCFNSRLVPRTPPEEGGCHLVHWVRVWAQVASQLKPAQVFLLGTACFFHGDAQGFSCGCGPVAQGRMSRGMRSCPCLFLLPFSSITICRAGVYAMNYFEYQSGRPCFLSSHHHSPFATLVFSPSSSALAQLVCFYCHWCSQCSLLTGRRGTAER